MACGDLYGRGHNHTQFCIVTLVFKIFGVHIRFPPYSGIWAGCLWLDMSPPRQYYMHNRMMSLYASHHYLYYYYYWVLNCI
jgi:hypothetical protein